MRGSMVLSGALVAMLALTGCGQAGDSAPATSTTTGAPASSSAAPSPTVDLAALRLRLKSATVSSGGFGAIDGPKASKEDDEQAYLVAALCGTEVESSAGYRGRHETFSRTWSADGWWIQSAVHGWTAEQGTTIVKLVESAATGCEKFDLDGEKYQVHPPVSLPDLPGVESSFAYCATVTRPNVDPYEMCRAYLASGSLVSVVNVIRGETVKAAQSGLIQVAGVAAEALAKPA